MGKKSVFDDGDMAPLRMDLAPRKSARRVQDVGGTSYPVIEP